MRSWRNALKKLMKKLYNSFRLAIFFCNLKRNVKMTLRLHKIYSFCNKPSHYISFIPLFGQIHHTSLSVRRRLRCQHPKLFFILLFILIINISAFTSINHSDCKFNQAIVTVKKYTFSLFMWCTTVLLILFDCCSIQILSFTSLSTALRAAGDVILF